MKEVKRHFLGWDQPFISSCAKWLQQHHLQEGLGGSTDLVLVVPGRSFGRNLQSQLVEKAYKRGRAIDLPEIVTSSRLLTRLLKSESPAASDALINMTTAAVLRDLPEEIVAPIIGTTQRATRDLHYWLLLSKEINGIANELSAGSQQTDASTWPSSAQELLTNKSRKRFDSIHTIRSLVLEKLEEDGFSISTEQWLSLSKEELRLPEQVVLLGTSDLHVVVRNALQLLIENDVDVAVLIHAPEERSKQFDEFGCVMPNAWSDVTIDIPDESIRVAGSPNDQANQLLRCISSLDGSFSEGEITVAVTDQDSIPLIQRQLEGHDVMTRYAGGKPILGSPETTLLKCVGEFAKTHSYSSYAALVRHPLLFKKLGNTAETLHELDRYYESHFPSKIGERWFIPEGFSKYANKTPLIKLHGKVFELLGPILERREVTLDEGCNIVRSLLLELYGDEELDRTSKKLAVLHGIFGVLDQFVSLPQATKDNLGKISTSLIIELVLEELKGNSIPDYPNEKAIDLVGWLEVMHEDSPCVFVVGMDSTLLSASAIGHPSIPNQLRVELGLDSVERKLARDAHAVMALQYARKQNGYIRWIVARKTKDGDPLTANQLLLRCEDDDQLAHRANKLIVELGAESPQVPQRLIQHTSSTCVGTIIVPTPEVIQKEPLVKLSATKFKDYIACPYRFWLRNVLKLGEERDNQVEMDYKLFGSLVHGAFEQFGHESTIRNSTDVSAIAKYLEHAVEEEMKKQFGNYPKATMEVQAKMAMCRMQTFAKLQAERVLEGWSIVDTERYVKWNVGTEEEPFLITGKIDRIDKHTDGQVQVLDYKTGSITAEKAHGTKDEWRDLQLPIYRRLAVVLGYPLEKIKTGYIRVGSKENSITFNLPQWDDVQLQCADDYILDIVEQVKACNFNQEPVSPAPRFSEDLSWICQDAGIISASEGDVSEDI